jgi:hypothetical protein
MAHDGALDALLVLLETTVVPQTIERVADGRLPADAPLVTVGAAFRMSGACRTLRDAMMRTTRRIRLHDGVVHLSADEVAHEIQYNHTLCRECGSQRSVSHAKMFAHLQPAPRELLSDTRLCARCAFGDGPCALVAMEEAVAMLSDRKRTTFADLRSDLRERAKVSKRACAQHRPRHGLYFTRAFVESFR